MDNQVPTLYMRRDCLDDFRAVIDFNDATMAAINRYQDEFTVEDIMKFRNKSIDRVQNPTMKDVYARLFWEQELAWGGILAMRSFFRQQCMDEMSTISFDDLKDMVHLIAALENERIAGDEEIEDWFYEKDFRMEAAYASKCMQLFFSATSGVKDWVDQQIGSKVEDKFDLPVAVRHNGPLVSAGFRINCVPRKIRQGTVVCTCEQQFTGVVREGGSPHMFTRCKECDINYHNTCQPCDLDEKCLRCRHQIVSLPLPSRFLTEDAMDEEDDEDEAVDIFQHAASALISMPRKRIRSDTQE
jgi:hypothetical protein